MQLEELQEDWKRLDQKLERSLKLQGELLRQAVLPNVRRSVQRLAFWPAIDIGLSVVTLNLVVAFLVKHWPDRALVIPSLAIAAAAVALLVDSVRQLAIVSDVDWSGPVADIQSSLERLRAARIWQFKWLLLLSPLIGLCAVIVGSTWLFSWLAGEKVNVVAHFPPAWVIANYAFGILFVPAGHVVARLLAGRFHGRAWWQRALDDISGKSLHAARERLSLWSSLDREVQA